MTNFSTPATDSTNQFSWKDAWQASLNLPIPSPAWLLLGDSYVPSDSELDELIKINGMSAERAIQISEHLKYQEQELAACKAKHCSLATESHLLKIKLSAQVSLKDRYLRGLSDEDSLA
jgi:hypothetical protein